MKIRFHAAARHKWSSRLPLSVGPSSSDYCQCKQNETKLAAAAALATLVLTVSSHLLLQFLHSDTVRQCQPAFISIVFVSLRA
jgi:hypothetical protein